jgi:predicted ATP-grasp superfamily ATP-dependent carboligase
MITKAFILGNHIQALGLARQLKEKNIVVTLFSKSNWSVSRFSNAVNHFVKFSSNNLLELLLLYKENNLSVMLVPTNDEMVAFLNDNRQLLQQYFHLCLPSSDNVALFYDKRNTYLFAQQYDIAIPKSWFPNSFDELEQIVNNLPYPVIIKPAVMHSFHKKTGKKALLCNGPEELKNSIQSLIKFFPFSSLIIQEFLSGGAPTLYSFGTFAVNGKPILSVVVNRIRQNPMTFGNSTTFAITCNQPQIVAAAEKILSLTNYTGLAEIEFMYDGPTDSFKFLEINPRAWKWHSITNALGFSFINAFADYTNKGVVSPSHLTNHKVAWVERLSDFAVIFKEVARGRMSLKDAMNTYQNTKEFAVWSSKDPLPFFMYAILSPYYYLVRH